MTAERRIRPLRGQRQIDVLSESDVERIHAATMTVLERVGLQITSERILRALADAGAKVDLDEQRVRFPTAMVEEKIALAPSEYLLAARDPALDVHVGAGNGYLTLDGCAAEIVDRRTGLRRAPVRQDLVEATRLADAVDEVSVMWSCVAVTDVPTSVQGLHQTLTLLANSTKHAVASSFSARDARTVIEMGRTVAGGAEALRARPIMSSMQCSISPLMWEGDVMEAAIEFAEAGIPCGFVAMAIGTATAPTTLAGHLVSVNAELLGGLAVLQTLVPGAATYYGPYQAFMDLQTGGIELAWGPEDVLFKLGAAQLARRYRLPMNILSFATGSKTQDWQAGAQHAISLAGVALAGQADLISGTGCVYGSRVFAFENVLLDAELFSLVGRLLEDVPAEDDDLALEVIEAIGPGGHYLAETHTRAHMRELWMPTFFGRDSWEDWEVAGKPEARDRAHARVAEIIEQHQPEPLPEDVESELYNIIESFERRTEGARHG
jgi:trimethylamine--corrinoid protein Co-methyltransferase